MPARSMYSELLDAAFGEPGQADGPPTTAGSLAELVRCRRLLEEDATHSGPDWALQAVADQLAYDAALIRLARRMGLACSIRDFDQPEQGRQRLERYLVDGGVLPDEPAEEEPEEEPDT